MNDNTKHKSTVLSTKTVFQSKYFRVNQVEISRDGKTFTKDIIEETPIVVVLPYTKIGEIYLALEYRDALGKSILNTIGGKIDKDEEPLISAKRELEEEVGLKAKVWKQIAIWERSATMQKKIYVFLATDIENAKMKPDLDEQITLKKLSIGEALDKIMMGEIVVEEDIATILLFDKLMKEGKIYYGR